MTFYFYIIMLTAVAVVAQTESPTARPTQSQEIVRVNRTLITGVMLGWLLCTFICAWIYKHYHDDIQNLVPRRRRKIHPAPSAITPSTTSSPRSLSQTTPPIIDRPQAPTPPPLSPPPVPSSLPPSSPPRLAFRLRRSTSSSTDLSDSQSSETSLPSNCNLPKFKSSPVHSSGVIFVPATKDVGPVDDMTP